MVPTNLAGYFIFPFACSDRRGGFQLLPVYSPERNLQTDPQPMYPLTHFIKQAGEGFLRIQDST